MTDDPEFYAWLDGELAEPEASAMAARVAADSALSALADDHRALASRLSAAFAPVADAPAPERLRAALTPAAAEVIDFTAARERRAARWSVSGLAMAASLALGLTVGVLLPRDGGDFASSGDRIAAAGELDGALDRQLASAGDVGGVRIGLSFKDSDGRYCRTFAQGTQSGLACRDGDGWAIEGLVRNPGSATDYRMASGGDPALGALIDSRLAGEPLDEQAERAAARAGWR